MPWPNVSLQDAALYLIYKVDWRDLHSFCHSTKLIMLPSAVLWEMSSWQAYIDANSCSVEATSEYWVSVISLVSQISGCGGIVLQTKPTDKATLLAARSKKWEDRQTGGDTGWVWGGKLKGGAERTVGSQSCGHPALRLLSGTKNEKRERANRGSRFMRGRLPLILCR